MSENFLDLKIPFWCGVSEKPTLNQELYPFSLQKNPDGTYSQVDKELVAKVIEKYSKEEYKHVTTPPGVSSWGNSRANVLLQYIDKNVNAEQLKNKKVLDIAGVNSYIADYLFDRYQIKDYTIVNPSIDQKNLDSKNLIKLINGYFPDALKDDNEKYDLILLFNCLEHVIAPDQMLKDIEKYLSPDGVLVLNTIDVLKLFRNGDLNALLHEHTVYFTPNSFSNVVNNANLQIENIIYENDGIITAIKKNHSGKQKFLEPEKIDLSIYYEQIDYLKNYFKQIKENNEKLIIHGACAGLFNICALVNDYVDISDIQIVDIDEFKHGKYMPGFKNKILLPDEIDASQVDKILVATSSFYDPISKYWIDRGIQENNIDLIYKTPILI